MTRTCQTTCHQSVGCQALCAPDEHSRRRQLGLSCVYWHAHVYCSHPGEVRETCWTTCHAAIGCQASPVPAPTAAPNPAPTPLITGLVSFKTYYATYLAAHHDGSVSLGRVANEEWEKFRVIDNKDGTISLLSFFGYYLGAERDGSLTCDRHEISYTEKWGVVQYVHTYHNSQMHFHTLKSYDNKYLCANEKNASLGPGAFFSNLADCPWESFNVVNGWESFNVVTAHENLFAFKAKTMRYISAQHDGSCTASEMEKSYGELFRLIRNNDGTVSLQTAHGNYVTMLPNGNLTATGKEIHTWERFILHPEGNKVSLKSVHGQYLSAKPSGSLAADRTYVSDLEKFTMETEITGVKIDLHNVHAPPLSLLIAGSCLAGLAALAAVTLVLQRVRKASDRCVTLIPDRDEDAEAIISALQADGAAE